MLVDRCEHGGEKMSRRSVSIEGHILSQHVECHSAMRLKDFSSGSVRDSQLYKCVKCAWGRQGGSKQFAHVPCEPAAMPSRLGPLPERRGSRRNWREALQNSAFGSFGSLPERRDPREIGRKPRRIRRLDRLDPFFD